jgi:glycine cleavage system H protein
MNTPEDLKYTKNHEWVRKHDDGTATVGITDFAQNELGDIVYVEVESEGETFELDGVFGSIEAVKTVSDLYSPMSGEVLEVNPELDGNPELVNEDPYGEGWIIKLKLSAPEEWDELLTADGYQAIIS